MQLDLTEMQRVHLPSSNFCQSAPKLASQPDIRPPSKTMLFEEKSKSLCSIDALNFVLPYSPSTTYEPAMRKQTPLLTPHSSIYSVRTNSSELSGLSTPTEYLFEDQQFKKEQETLDFDIKYDQNMASSDFLDSFLNSFDQDTTTSDRTTALFQKQFSSFTSLSPLDSLSSLSFNLPFPDLNNIDFQQSEQINIQNRQNIFSEAKSDKEKHKRQSKKRQFDIDVENDNNNIISPKLKQNKISKRTILSGTKSEYFFETENIMKSEVERVKTKKGLRKRRRNEWSSEEVVLLLLTTKKLINYELKTISQAVFEMIKRDPGKCFGRAAEKKLKRLNIFENWKTCDKTLVIQKIEKLLKNFEPLTAEKEEELVFFVEKAKRESEENVGKINEV